MAHQHTRARRHHRIHRIHRIGGGGDPETAVLRAVSWVMLALGIIALSVFATAPDFHAYPGVLLLGITGVIGCGVLRLLAWALASRPSR